MNPNAVHAVPPSRGRGGVNKQTNKQTEQNPSQRDKYLTTLDFNTMPLNETYEIERFKFDLLSTY